jgi:indole-3-glycerol phosphate synthase
MFVSESGIKTRDDIKILEENDVNAVLIGETLMRSDDIISAVRRLKND